MSTAWWGDRLVDLDDGVVALDDHGFTTGDGCFETMVVLRDAPFAVTRHLARLRRSCAGLGIEAPGDDLVRRACAAVLAANPGAGRLRVTVTAGRAPIGSHRGGEEPTLTVLAGPAPTWEATTAVAVCPWVRNERSPTAGLKTTSYADNVVALAWARERGCSEALFANTRGELCEGAGTNVFVALGGRLVTPPLESGCLPGITRELLVDVLGPELGVAVEPVAIEALGAAEEVFVTSSTRHVQPVHTVDGRPVPPPVPGPLTARAQAALRQLQERTLDP